MEQETIHTLSKVADAVTDKEIHFEIIIHPQNRLHRWLQKKKYRPLKEKFTLKPLVVGNVYRISRLLLKIDTDLLKGKNYLDIAHQLVTDHAMMMVEIVAIAIQNTRAEPSKKLMDLLKENLSAEEMAVLVKYVMKQMDLESFIVSIISMRGLNVLESGEKKKGPNEVSPMSQGS